MPHVDNSQVIATTPSQASSAPVKNAQIKKHADQYATPPKFVAIPNFPASLHGEWTVIAKEPYLHAIMRFSEGLCLVRIYLLLVLGIAVDVFERCRLCFFFPFGFCTP